MEGNNLLTCPFFCNIRNLFRHYELRLRFCFVVVLLHSILIEFLFIHSVVLSAECSCDRPRTDEFVLRAYYAGPSGVEEPSAGIFYQKYLAHRKQSPQELQYDTPHLTQI